MWFMSLIIESPINRMLGLSFPFLVFWSRLSVVFLDILASEFEAFPFLQLPFLSPTVALCWLVCSVEIASSDAGKFTSFSRSLSLRTSYWSFVRNEVEVLGLLDAVFPRFVTLVYSCFSFSFLSTSSCSDLAATFRFLFSASRFALTSWQL